MHDNVREYFCGGNTYLIFANVATKQTNASRPILE